ncbi:hypothetical protein I2F17_09280 [Acinetobacter sp. B10A]|uniref:hypothetical protein n=1 Tax=Acinetobacter baretiae TaxID=2605383 RepID=UPI001B3C633C|nr:hypothetical protein [Acinetobacter baretiae]MBF7686008.1 hypothetical protein [Acinetobacter baretiae]
MASNIQSTEIEQENPRTAQEIVDQTHDLAEAFYRIMGYEHSREKHGNLYDSQHPTELMLWDFACLAQEEIIGAVVSDYLEELKEND